MTDPLSPALYAPLFSSAAMRAIVNDRARLQRMLDFEAALARAEGALGVISAGASREISDACQASRYDLAALAEAAVPASNLAIPIVNALVAEVGKRSKDAAGYVHWGATSQDMIDTALVLELRAAIDVLLADLDRATKAFTTLAGRYRRTMSVARTLMQQAIPMPFGLKLAGYAAALGRSRDRLRRLRKEALALQFGGAAGTLAALGERGLDVTNRLAALLDLPVPDAPWHTHRDRLAEVAAALGILAGTCGKIARDVALLMQSEVGEAFEPAAAGRGGSSTMPHKRNPIAATAALSAATIAPNLVATILSAQIQEHERAVGAWQAEWVTFPALTLVTSGALAAVVDIAEGLEVDVDRMKANLESSGGQVFAEAVSFALAKKLGKAEAHKLTHELTEQAAKDKRSLQETLQANERAKAALEATDIARLFMPTSYQGIAQTFIDRLIASAQGRSARRPIEAEPQPSRPPMVAVPAQPKEQKIAPATTPNEDEKPAPVAAAASMVPPAATASAAPPPVTPATAPSTALAPAADSAPVPPAPPAPVPPVEAPPLRADEEPSALMEAFNNSVRAAEDLARVSSTDNKR
jgi:3-carboxy-cis,cis-muconate cycloisomerase